MLTVAQKQDHLHLLGAHRDYSLRMVPGNLGPSLADANTQWSMLYASTMENFKSALNIHTSIHADDKSDIEWKTVLFEASGGKVGK
jgi:hypothetical protein